MLDVDTGLKDAEIKRIFAVIHQNPKIRKIMLFGSRALYCSTKQFYTYKYNT